MTSGLETLRGVAEAARVHSQFPRLRQTSSFDVLGLAMELNVPVIFRPLKGLWGATVRVGDNAGVLVTTNIGRPVQRFTLAHELGHFLLGHRISLDKTVGFADGWQRSPSRPEEVGADAFASELLASRDLIRAVCQQHKWTQRSLGDARRVYQLSLRIGVSYTATCWALGNNQIIPKNLAAKLADVTLQSVKQGIVSSEFLQDSWADVWELMPTDSETSIEAGPFDVFVLNLEEQASGGYLWLTARGDAGLRILSEHSEISPVYGDSSVRKMVLRFESPDHHRCQIEHKRPWNEETIETFDMRVDTRGKETPGLPRRVRERVLAAA